MMEFSIDRAEILDSAWEELVRLAMDYDIDLRSSTSCKLMISDIEPSAPNMEDFEIYDEEEGGIR